MAYKLKVWRLPDAPIHGRGKAMVNLLPLQPGERITTVLPLPEDEAEWEKLNVVFATKSGDVRRNELSDFASINRNGKIAMKLADGDGIVGVQTCTEHDDILLTTRLGKCIRFSVNDVRVFKGRDSTGVRGIKLATGDEVVSLSLLHHSDATTCRSARLSETGECCAPRRLRRRRRSRRRRTCGRGGTRRGGDADAGALRRPGRQGAVRARRLRKRLRQAHELLRISRHGPRRLGHRRHGHGPEEQRPSSAAFPVEETTI